MASQTLPWYDLYDRVEGALWNAYSGTLSPAQKQALIAQETKSVVAAGGDPTSAANQAQTDVTNTLLLNKADPSQASLLGSPGIESLVQKAGWVIALLAVGAFLYFAIEAWRMFHAAQA